MYAAHCEGGKSSAVAKTTLTPNFPCSKTQKMCHNNHNTLPAEWFTTHKCRALQYVLPPLGHSLTELWPGKPIGQSVRRDMRVMTQSFACGIERSLLHCRPVVRRSGLLDLAGHSRKA